ncbi:MAG: AAA family ATPase [Planctomycetes bacterium]|nr:AAA family ATPase [Planctomycetota bacterium]
MYLQYWNLDRPPFECDFHPTFFFRSRSHQAALLKLRYLIEGNKGAGLLVGDTGAGKSFLTSFLAAELDSNFEPFVTLHYPLLNPTELIAWLAAELGAGAELHDSEQTVDRLLLSLKSALSHHSENERHPVIVLDDAHLIEDSRVFQTLQLILNLRHETPFTVILTGQPSLLTQVAQVPALDQRLGARSLLKPFSREETAAYIRHRLLVAGLQSDVFAAEALNEIHELSGGLPRQINRLADLALLVGYADNLSALEPQVIGSVAAEIGVPTC